MIFSPVFLFHIVVFVVVLVVFHVVLLLLLSVVLDSVLLLLLSVVFHVVLLVSVLLVTVARSVNEINVSNIVETILKTYG
jgi:hypothetical protein